MKKLILLLATFGFALCLRAETVTFAFTANWEVDITNRFESNRYSPTNPVVTRLEHSRLITQKTVEGWLGVPLDAVLSIDPWHGWPLTVAGPGWVSNAPLTQLTFTQSTNTVFNGVTNGATWAAFLRSKGMITLSFDDGKGNSFNVSGLAKATWTCTALSRGGWSYEKYNMTCDCAGNGTLANIGPVVVSGTLSIRQPPPGSVR